MLDFKVLEVRDFPPYDPSEVSLVRITDTGINTPVEVGPRPWRVAYYRPEVGEELSGLRSSDITAATPEDAMRLFNEDDGP
jgi:hypothetical protein